MKKLFFILAMVLTLVSCERSAEVSPIKGVWKCQLNGTQMTLDYGDRDVTYKCYIQQHNATAIYEGTYTIKGNEITQVFTSLTTKNSSKVEFYSPEKMPKEATLKDNNTIIYMDYPFKRK